MNNREARLEIATIQLTSPVYYLLAKHARSQRGVAAPLVLSESP
jgi:hypothetical protein